MDRPLKRPAQPGSVQAECGPLDQTSGGSVEQLFHRLSVPLKRYAIGLGFRPEEADEAVQEGFLRLQVAFSRHELVHNPAAFLHTVIRHLLIDCARLQNRFDDYAGHLQIEAPGPQCVHSDSSADLLRLAQGLLSPRETEVFTLRREGKSYGEISASLGIRPATVGALVSRAMFKLRRHAGRSK
ncbi:MAG TPA: RNA polymerase sigma factor [Bryobacteraceae bacterium]|nr:RNA polymerase sigma factor [Bryobacteraceae bacterium]HPT25051.1 RNA polymerase sigma factor [Bryobacteraceae bacterium]